MHPRRSTKKWTWVELLDTYPKEEGEFPGAAPVSAFKYQKAPLSPHWDLMTIMGMVGEIEVEAYLDNYVSNKKKQLLTEKSNRKKTIVFWFVEVIQVEGYILKVRFLGFSPNLTTELKKYERWIHYNQLQEIGYYKQRDGIAAIPLITGYKIQSREETSDRLCQQIVGKITVTPLRFGWLKQEQERIRWKPGTKVEVRNRDCCTEMVRGSVIKTVGRRVQVEYWDTVEKSSGIWVHEDSDLIQLEGWCRTTGGKLKPSMNMENYDDIALSPTKLGLDLTSQDQVDAFAKMKVDMLFEFINPIRSNEIAVGQITCVLNHGYFNCRIVSPVLQVDLDNHTRGLNEFHYHLSSGQLFPLGTFFDGMPTTRIIDNVEEVEEFDWGSYLAETGFEVLAFPPKGEMDDVVHNFQKNMWVEAVDSHQPELVCPAMIVDIVQPYAMKIRFVGWTHEFDQWKPIKSLEVFPIGWCQFNDYVLEIPKHAFIELSDEMQYYETSPPSETIELKKQNIPIHRSSSESEAGSAVAVASDVEPKSEIESADCEK